MAFIEIETDTLLVLNVFENNAPGRVEITSDQQKTISNSKFGHAQFMYMNGDLVESPDILSEATSKRTITRFQALAALHQAGLLDAVNSLMNDPTIDPIAKLAWENAQSFNSKSPTLLLIAQQLGLTDIQLNKLFAQASVISA